MVDEKVESISCVENVFDEQDIFAFNVNANIFNNADYA